MVPLMDFLLVAVLEGEMGRRGGGGEVGIINVHTFYGKFNFPMKTKSRA